MKELIRNILKNYILEQRVPRGYWNPETLKQEAEKYETEGEFIQKSNSAYQTARRMGILDYVLQNLKPTERKKYKKEDIIKLAKKFNKKNDFKKAYPLLYNVARKHGWWDEASSHMVDAYLKWNKEDVHKEALKYKYPSEFEKNSSKAYGAAAYNGWLDDVTSHMEKLGSLKKRMVYAYEFPDNFVYVGLTYHKDKRHDTHMKSGPVHRHMQETGLTPVRIEVSDYIDAQEASRLEQSTEKKYRDEGWNILNQAKPGVLGGSTPIWTPETVRAEASKYETLADFRKHSPKAFGAAQRNGWVPELGLKNTDVRWDYESVAALAKKYKTRKEFGDNHHGAYQFATRNKILDDITKHMEVKQIKWTKELAAQEALNYKTRNDFAKGSKKAYHASLKYGWIDDITQHMVSGIKTHTRDEIKKVADNYQDYSEFAKDHPVLSQYVRKKGWDDLVQHMEKKKIYTPDELEKEALKYNTIGEFIKNNKNAYQAANRRGILQDITKHMIPTRTKWTKELIYREAKKYNSRHEFEKGNGSAYQAAKREGYLDDLFPNPKSKGINQWMKKE